MVGREEELKKMAVKRITIKATITESSAGGKPTIRLFLTSKQKWDMRLQKGKHPDGFFNIILM